MQLLSSPCPRRVTIRPSGVVHLRKRRRSPSSLSSSIISIVESREKRKVEEDKYYSPAYRLYSFRQLTRFVCSSIPFFSFFLRRDRSSLWVESKTTDSVSRTRISPRSRVYVGRSRSNRNICAQLGFVARSRRQRPPLFASQDKREQEKRNCTFAKHIRYRLVVRYYLLRQSRSKNVERGWRNKFGRKGKDGVDR